MSALTPAGVDIEIHGQTITFQPLVFEDIEWLELRLRARAIEAGRLSIPETASPAEREKLMDEILAHAQKIDLLESFNTLFTVTGIALLLYRMSFRTKGVQVTLPMVSTWVQDAEVMARLKPQIAQLASTRKKSQAETSPPPLKKSRAKK